MFVTRQNCPLCDEGFAHLTRLVALDEILIVDVDRDDGLAEYSARVPVVLGPAGQVIAEGRFTRAELRRALRGTAG